MAVPSLRDDARNVAWWLSVGFVVGALAGGLIGGLGGRVAMLVLRLTSDADGLISDDGFTIGQFTLSDTLQLYAAMAFAGAINGVAYVAVRALLPTRGRIVLWGVLGATVVGSMVVKTDGADFILLEPRWFAIAAFVGLPGLAALAIAWLVERTARIEPWSSSGWLGLLMLPAAPALLGAPAFLLGAVAFFGLGRIDWVRRLPSRSTTRLIAVVVLTAAALAGAVDVMRDALELL